MKKIKMKHLCMLVVFLIEGSQLFGWDLIGSSKNWHMLFLICVNSYLFFYFQEKIAKYYCGNAKGIEDEYFDTLATSRTPEDRAFVGKSFLSIFLATILSFAASFATEVFLQAWYTHAERHNIPDMNVEEFKYIVLFTILLAVLIGPVKLIKKQTFNEYDQTAQKTNIFGLKSGRGFIIFDFSLLQIILSLKNQ